MMTQVADQILNQFGKSFAAKAAALAARRVAETEAADAATAVEEPQAINGLAFAWSVIVGFVKSLFGKKRSNVELSRLSGSLNGTACRVQAPR